MAGQAGFKCQDYALRVAGYAADDRIIKTRNSHPGTRPTIRLAET